VVKKSTNTGKITNHLLTQSTEHKKDPQHMVIEIQVLIWDKQMWQG